MQEELITFPTAILAKEKGFKEMPFYITSSTEDVFGFAVKATYGEVNNIGREIYKDPITDNGTKKSAKGLTVVYKNENDDFYLKDQATMEEVMSEKNELKVRFRNGQLFNQTTLSEIRERINKTL